LSRFRVQSVLFELPSSPAATMSDERRAVRSICDSRPKFFRGCQYTRSSYLRDGALHNAGHREGRQGAAAFFQRHRKASVLARECHHESCRRKRSFANEMSRRVDDIARCGRWRMATADGVDAKLVRPSIQVDAGLMGSVGAVPRKWRPLFQAGRAPNVRSGAHKPDTIVITATCKCPTFTMICAYVRAMPAGQGSANDRSVP
jgi:hypothetical protein